MSIKDVLPLSAEQMDRLVDQVIAKMKEEEQNKLDFFTHQLKGFLPRFSEYMKKGKRVDDEELLYDNERQIPFTSVEYHYFFELVMDYAIRANKTERDEHNPFPNQVCYLLLNGMHLRFWEMSGQGTASICALVDQMNPELWNETLVFTLEELMD